MVKYLYLLLAMCLVGCSDAVVDDGYDMEGEGEVSFDVEVVTSKASSGLSDEAIAALMESSVLKIYDSSSTLIRRYAPVTECPDYLALVSGNYTAILTMGSGDVYTTDDSNLTFYGEQSFAVTAGGTCSVDLECDMLNTKISTLFDDSLDDNLEAGYTLAVAVASEITDEMLEVSYTDKLSFTDEGSGYVIAGGESIAWHFEGLIKNGETLSTGGVVVASAAAGEEYALTLKYDKYLQFSGSVEVDESTVDHDDHFSFSIQPNITSDFSAGEVQMIEGDYVFAISSELYTLTDVDVVVGDATYQPFVDGEVKGVSNIAYEKSADKTGTLTISSDVFAAMEGAGEHSITIEVTDDQNGVGKRVLTVARPGIIGVENIDLWYNSATVTFCSVESTTPILKYGVGSATTSVSYSKIDGTTYCYSASIAPTWTELTNVYGLQCYEPSNGIWAGKNYAFSLVDGENTYSSEVATGGAQTIPNGDMSNSSLLCYGNEASSSSTDWASGNNDYSKTLCSYSDGMAYLKSTKVSVVIVNKFAAGNLVYGRFVMGSTSGTMYFGQKFTWESRPKSLNVRYKATTGGTLQDGDGNTQTKTVTYADETVTYTKDRGRIYFAIVNWGSQRGVTAGSSSSTGMWDPEASKSITEGNIIGYGSYYIDETTSAMADLEIPIYYYDKTTKPSSDVYSLVISGVASAYGDYMIGSTSSELWLDDFEFGY